MSRYKTASVRYGDTSYSILLQEAKGPCPLIALCNYIILSFRVHIQTTVDADGIHVSEEYLFKVIKTVLSMKIGLVLKDEAEISKVKEGLYDLLLKLKNDIYANPELTSIKDFSQTPEMLLFTYLGIPLLHGWIPKPEDENTIKKVGKSYDELSKKLAFYESREGSLQPIEETDYRLIKDFLDETKSQLTLHGLSSLRIQMIELLSEKKGNLAMLFRNGHFYVMHLYRGTLHTLATDYVVRSTFPFIAWKTLNNVTGNGISVTSDYIATRTMDEETLDKLYSDGDLEMHLYSLKLSKDKEEILPENVNQTSQVTNEQKKGDPSIEVSDISDKQKKGGDPSCQAPHVKNWKEKKENPYSQASKVANRKEGKKGKKKGRKAAVAPDKRNVGVPGASPEEPPTARPWFVNRFLKFLNGACCERSQRPYYVGKVAAMKHWNCFDMCIEYSHIEDWDKKFARFIRDDYESMHHDIEASVIQFLKDNGVDESEATKATALISNLPVSFTSYVKKHQDNLVEHYELYVNNFVKSTSRIGKKMARKFLKFIIDKHREGWCWNGEWKVSDMEIQDGGRAFVIGCLAWHCMSKDGMIADFEKFVEIMFSHYASEEIDSVSGGKKMVLPCYFNAFIKDISDVHVPNPDDEPEKLLKFQRYLSCHLAFMSPLACSDYIGHLYTVSDRLCSWARNEFPFHNPQGQPNWRDTVRPLPEPFASIYAHKNYLRGPEYDKYSAGGYFFLIFLRNFTQHMLKQAKTDLYIVAVHLYIAYHLEYLMAQLILFMNYNCNCDLGGPFASTWTKFEDSE